MALYGHGLLGEPPRSTSRRSARWSSDFDFAYCATDWKGMAMEDVPNVGLILNDLSRFPTLTDRLQQGILNFLYLGRLMITRKGFPGDPALRAARASTPRTCSTTATARAGSTAAR